MKKTLIILIIGLLFACNPCRYVSNHPECFPGDTITITNTKTVYDSITIIEADSSSIIAYLECDSSYNVLIKSLYEYKGNGLKSKVIYKDNRFEVKNWTDSILVLNKIIEIINNEKTVKVNPLNESMKKDLYKYKKRIAIKNRYLYISGSLNLLLLLIIGLYIYIKIKK